MESDDEHPTGTFVEPENMKEVLGLFSLFPSRYEFYKDDIIQLWMARNTEFRWTETTKRQWMENTKRRIARMATIRSRLLDTETIYMKLLDTETIYMKLQMQETADKIGGQLTIILWRMKEMMKGTKISEHKRKLQLPMEVIINMSRMMQSEFSKMMETKVKKMESVEMMELELVRVKTIQFKLKSMLDDINDGTTHSLTESKKLGHSMMEPWLYTENFLMKKKMVEKEKEKMRSIQGRDYAKTMAIDTLKLKTEVSSIYFDHLETIQLLVMATDLDSMTSLPRYKLNHGHPLWFQYRQYHNYHIRTEGGESSISENTLHCSIGDVTTIDPITLQNLQQAKLLQTLIIHGSQHLGLLPRELFIMLPYLKILDLSGTSITELPSSIGRLYSLKYLNLSGTLITTLPYSLFMIYGMQTLKLRGCLKLVSLPSDITNLKYLLHLDVDVTCLLASMPPGIGNFTQLRTLPAFVVGKKKGYHITELRKMNLYGTLSIFRLEYVSTKEEAAEAGLINKSNLRTLELHWTESRDGSTILENLRPPTQIKELQIVGYGGAKLSSWLGDPVYFTLTTITIHDCISCIVLPPLGKLPCLKILCISGMGEVDEINNQLCGRLGSVLTNDYMFNAFPCLESLTLDEMPKLKEWQGIEKGDFPHLQDLNISSCPQLTTLPELSILESLEQLEISSCPLLEYFPTKGLPTSLQYLVIIGCPLLKESFHEEEGQDGAHVPSVWIDYQQMSLGPRA